MGGGAVVNECWSFIFLLAALFCLISCNNPVENSTPSPVESTPNQSSLDPREDCNWETQKLNIFENKNTFVSFRHLQCGNEEFTSFVISNEGTQISKMTFDLVTDKFHIFERTAEPIDVFIQSLPQKIFKVGENCYPKKISEKFWFLEDGLAPEAEINAMPCGLYGRNFSGQTRFEVRDEVILNYGTYFIYDGIDKSSITLVKAENSVPKP